MRATLLAILLLPVLAAAGCGGEEVRVEDVPGSPPPLALPASGESDLGTAADDDESDDAKEDEPDTDAGADAGAAATPAAPADSGGATVPPADTGGAAPDPTATAAPQDPAATGGAEADAGSDEFCADNPGAC